MNKIMLSDFKYAIDKFIDEYGDAEIFTIVRHNNRGDKEYSIILGNGQLNSGLSIPIRPKIN